VQLVDNAVKNFKTVNFNYFTDDDYDDDMEITNSRSCRSRRLVVNRTPRMPGFNPKPGCLGFMVDNIALGHDFILILLFSLSVSLCQRPVLIHLCNIDAI
jgi:hypothetical protein